MLVIITRDSVCAGDDCDAPHLQTLVVPEGIGVGELIGRVVRATELASIKGGKATWCLRSGIPLAVVAQEWREPRMVGDALERGLGELEWGAEGLKVHFSYHCQEDPEKFWRSLQR